MTICKVVSKCYFLHGQQVRSKSVIHSQLSSWPLFRLICALYRTPFWSPPPPLGKYLAPEQLNFPLQSAASCYPWLHPHMHYYPELVCKIPDKICRRKCLYQLYRALSGLYPASCLVPIACIVQLSPCVNRAGHCLENSLQGNWKISVHMFCILLACILLSTLILILQYVQVHVVLISTQKQI